MPPKPQPMARTLSAFFSKDDASPAQMEHQQEQSASAQEQKVGEDTTPEKPKRKRASKAKKAESVGAPVVATEEKLIASPKKKSRSKVELLTEVEILVRPSVSTKAAKPVQEHQNIATDLSPLAEKAESTLLTPTPPKAAKKAPPSPSKPAPTVVAGAASSSVTASVTNASRMFKVRNGKTFFSEQKLKYYSHPATVMDLANFHAFRGQLQEAANPLQYPGVRTDGSYREITTIPREHLGLFAKLAEESDQSLSDLATGLMTSLCPLDFEQFGGYCTSVDTLAVQKAETDHDSMDVDVDVETVDIDDTNKTPSVKWGSTRVSLAAVMDAIQTVAKRVNYGVPISNLPNSVPVTPANLSIFRWEVQDIDQYFPADMRAAVTQRRSKRMEASAAMTAWFLSLETKQQDEFCPAVKVSLNLDTSQPAEGMDIDVSAQAPASKDGGARPVLLDSAIAVEAVVDPAVLEAKLKEAEVKKKEAELKEEKRLDKERKLAERQLEKEQKEAERLQKEAERLQKEEAKKQKAEEERLKKEQTSLRFVGFFKPATAPVSKKEGVQEQIKNDNPCASQSELFHPFHVKKNTTLAPINSFATKFSTEAFDQELGLAAYRATGSNDTEMDMDVDTVPQLGAMNMKTLLPSLFPTMGRRSEVATRKSKLPPQTKYMSVPEVIQSGLLLQEHDEDLSYLLTWKDIPCLRMRLFQFVENYRPAYYGTWSKRSKRITGRRFLGKDTVLIDYDVDSEAEWEEDEEGEECKSDDEDEDAEEVGSEQDEEDDWLVPEGYLSEDEGMEVGEEGGSKDLSASKKSKDARRPNATHVAPVIVGPIFETTLGEYSCHPALEAYHIEFLTDYDVGMDMFHTATLPPPTGIQV
ncbi:chromatin assembly factor 1 subunit A [Entomortierella parvispora]|uniref:Chromatin assembly factor 1 subunit A n=1 Tax=Entomortierella parvispora TaxID=205924 RepID=A0A9P3HHS0_9FUNG|nr:chromatin assembly factor 1 subunit A [Entomortierella parvispora]